MDRVEYQSLLLRNQPWRIRSSLNFHRISRSDQ